MPKVTSEKSRILKHRYGGGDYTRAATVKVGFHRANTLTANANIGQTSISVTDPVTNGVEIIINPETVNAETRTVTGVSGGGPYTVSFSGALVNNHLTSDLVLVDPGPDGENIVAPSGGGYAQVTVDNDTDHFTESGGVAVNVEPIVFGDLSTDIGYATHGTVKNGDTNNLMDWGRLTTKLKLDTISNPITIPPGNMIIEE